MNLQHHGSHNPCRFQYDLYLLLLKILQVQFFSIEDILNLSSSLECFSLHFSATCFDENSLKVGSPWLSSSSNQYISNLNLDFPLGGNNFLPNDFCSAEISSSK